MPGGVAIAQLFASIGADTKAFDKGLAHVDSALGKTGKSFGLLQSVGGAAMLGIAGAAAGAAAGIAGIAVAATKSAAQFEQGIANIRADLNLTAEDTEKVSKLVKDLGLDPKLQVSASQASEAIHMLGKNGLTLQQILDGAARSTVLLANSTGGSFAESADIATDVMSLFNIKAEEMNRAINGIVGTTQFSKFSIQDYALALAQGGGVASSVGVSFEDFNATIAAISPLFASGSDAGTSFKVFLQRLVPQTEKAKDLMKQLGLMTEDGSNAFFDANGNMKNMTEIAGLLQEAFKGLTEEQKNAAASTIFGTDAMRAAFGLATAGSSGISKFLADIGSADAEKAGATRMDTFNGQLEIFRGIIETLGIDIGQKFLPVSRKMVERFSELASKHGPMVVEFFGNLAMWLGENIDKAIDFGTAMAKRFLPTVQRVAKFLLTTVPKAFKNFRLIFDNINDPDFARNINRIGSAFAGLGRIVGNLVRPFKDMFSGLFEELMGARARGFSGVFDVLSRRLMTALSQFGSVMRSEAIPFVLDRLSELGRAITTWISSVNWWATIKTWSDFLWGWAVGAWELLKPYLMTFWNSLSSWFTDPEKRAKLQNAVGQGWNVLVEWATSIWELAKPYLLAGWNWLTSWFTDPAKRTVLWDAIVTGWNILTTWATNIWEWAKPALTAGWDWLSSWFTDPTKRQALWDTVVTGWNILVNWAKDIWTLAEPHLAAGWNWLTSWFTDPTKRQQLWDGIVKAWDFLTEWAKDIWDWADDPLKKGFNWLTSWFTNPQKRQQLWDGIRTAWDFVTEWAGKVWEWAEPKLLAAWVYLHSWITDPVKRQQLIDAIANAWTFFTDWAGKVWDDGQGGGIKSWLDNAWTSMDTWIDTNLPVLTPWKDAFVGFAEGAAEQWNISFPNMQDNFAKLVDTVTSETPKIGDSLKDLWHALFGGDEAGDSGAGLVLALDRLFEAISQTLGTIIKQSRILIDILTVTVELVKAMGSGDFDKVMELNARGNALWAEFGQVTGEQWNWFKDFIERGRPQPPDFPTGNVGGGGGGGGFGGFAHGGRVNAAGVHWVGENGPELVNLPYGARVFNNADSMGMMGGRLDLYVHGDSNLPADRNKLRELARMLQQELQLRGARVALA